MDFAEVTKICSDYTTNGLDNMTAVTKDPFRFVYISGVAAERDQTKSLALFADYRLMRVSSLPFPHCLLSTQPYRLTSETRAASRTPS